MPKGYFSETIKTTIKIYVHFHVWNHRNVKVNITLGTPDTCNMLTGIHHHDGCRWPGMGPLATTMLTRLWLYCPIVWHQYLVSANNKFMLKRCWTITYFAYRNSLNWNAIPTIFNVPNPPPQLSSKRPAPPQRTPQEKKRRVEHNQQTPIVLEGKL